MADRDLAAGLPAGELPKGKLVAGRFGETPVELVRHAGKICARAVRVRT